MLHRSRQGSSARVEHFLSEPPIKLEVTMELGFQGETPPGACYMAIAISSGGDAGQTNRS